jgi:glycosyltransferase involved in cell wall biosynthesis
MSPRGQREAAVLQETGYEVTISGLWFNAKLARIDEELQRRLKLRFRPALDLRPHAAPARRLWQRARGRWARERFVRTRRFSPELLGYGAREQLREARRGNADLTIVHGEAGLWIARELAREGRRVGVDFEDWFSRDLPESARRTRPVAELARLEAAVLRDAVYSVASSQAMARELARAHGVREPGVVTNAGPARAESRPRADGPLRLHWFSQTIGPGRGLDLLFAAMPLVSAPVRLTLRGACSPDHRAWLEGIIPARARESVTIEPPVPPWQLPKRVAEHDVGLVLETCEIPSRDLCIPNKFFHYLASGLAVIATRTLGLHEALAPCPGAGVLVNELKPPELAAAIDAFASEPGRLATARAAARRGAETIWNGDREREVIIAEAWRALGAR